MKKYIGFVLAAVLGLGTLAVAADVAEHHGRHRGMRGEMMMGLNPHDLERLNLTADQKQKLDGIRKSQREQMRSQFQSTAQEHQALMAEIYKDNPNPAEIQKHLATIQQAQAAMFNQRVQALVTFSQSLTPEQRAEMQKVLAEHAQRREQMRQKWEQRQQQNQSQPPQAAPDKPQS
jgi:Spy/CpxP family protein refolding chaperone